MDLPFDDYAHELISKLDLSKTGTDEFSGRCPNPNCIKDGGKDRFRISNYNGKLKHHCRKECSLKDRTNALRDLGLIPPYKSPSAFKNTNRAELRSHIYEDESSTPVRKAIKYSDGSWTQQRFKGVEWLYGVKDTPNILYGLPRLLEDHTDNLVFVFEGEKDCELAWDHGLLATTNVGGAGNWKDELNKPLEGRTVCLVPDNDNAGSNHVTKVSKSLTESGIQNFILWNYRENLSEKGDFSDWMAANNNQVDEFLNLVKEEQRNPSTPPELQHSDNPTKFLHKFGIMSAVDLVNTDLPEPEFLLEGIIPKTGLAMIAGGSKAGKSWANLRFCKEIAEAGYKVFYLSTEDNKGRAKKRVKMVFGSSPHPNFDVLPMLSEDITLPRGKEALEFINELFRWKKYDLIVIDTVAAILEPKTNNKNYEISEAEYAAIRKVAHEHQKAIFVTTHTKKSNGDTGVPKVEQILGSTGISATVETILIMEKVIGKRDCKLHVTGKDVEEQDLYLQWNNMDGFEIRYDFAEAQLGPVQQQILDHIKDNPRCTQKQIVEVLGKDQGQISKALTSMEDSEVILKNHHNNSYMAYAK